MLSKRIDNARSADGEAWLVPFLFSLFRNAQRLIWQKNCSDSFFLVYDDKGVIEGFVYTEGMICNLVEKSRII